MDNSLSISAFSSPSGACRREEPQFSVSMIMLLMSWWWKESKVKMWPSCSFSVVSCRLRLSIWYLNHSFSWLRFTFSSFRYFSKRYILSLEVRNAFLQYSFSAFNRSIRVSSFQLSVLRFESFRLLERRLSCCWFLCRTKRSFFPMDFSGLSSEAATRLRFWMKRFCLGRTLSRGRGRGSWWSLRESLEWRWLLLHLELLLVLLLGLVEREGSSCGRWRSLRRLSSILPLEVDLESDLFLLRLLVGLGILR